MSPFDIIGGLFKLGATITRLIKEGKQDRVEEILGKDLPLDIARAQAQLDALEKYGET